MFSLLDDIWDWLWAVLDQWQVLVTGGFITAVVVGVQAWRDKTFSVQFNKVLIFGFFVVAAIFLAWREQRKAAVVGPRELSKVQQELVTERDNNKPKLVGKFLQTIGGDAADAKGAGAWLELQIVNQGTPSIVLPDSWRASVTTADGQIRRATLNQIRDGSQIHMADGKIFAIGPPDAIYETASTRAIDRGSIAHGWLELYFEGAKYQDLVAPGAKWEVQAEDVLGNRWIASFTYKGGERMPGPNYYPGSGVIK